MKLSFLPQPHSVKFRTGSFRFPKRGVIAVDDWSLYEAAKAARSIFAGLEISAVSGKNDTMRIVRCSGLRPGGYVLDISKQRVTLRVDSVPAAFHGVETLGQIAGHSGPEDLPCLRVDDWPDFAVRGVYLDVSRGRVPELETLKTLVDLLARYRINQIQLYVEHTFRFRSHPEIGRGASPLTAEDILELDSACLARNIELVPSLATFGHMSNVLRHGKYRRMAEDYGAGRKFKGWTISPANPGTYAFLDSLFAEFLPLFSSDKFNVCCDETYDLGEGQTAELCRKKGKGRIYLEHILRLRKMAAKYGKKIQFWGDIILGYPELIGEIPDDVTVLVWGYNHNEQVEKLANFKKAGLPFYACPGTSSWVSLFPRLPEATENISRMAEAAGKYGATGVLNTDWGDGGHYNFTELSWHGFLFGAEQSWNVRADRSSFAARFARHFLRSDSPALVEAIRTLGDVAQLGLGSRYQSAWRHVFFAVPSDSIFSEVDVKGTVGQRGMVRSANIRFDADLGRRTMRSLARVRAVLEREARKPGVDPGKVLPYWIFAVDTIIHAARKLAVFGKGGRNTRSARKTLESEMSKLMKRFELLWMKRNRRSEISKTLNAYRRVLKALMH